ncbi:hypothetical protein [Sporosarcina sp. NPDC096371]
MKKFLSTVLLVSVISIVSAPNITPYQDEVNHPQKTAMASTIHQA